MVVERERTAWPDTIRRRSSLRNRTQDKELLFPDGSVDKQQPSWGGLQHRGSVTESQPQTMRDQYAPENSAPADERAAWREIARAAAKRRHTQRG